MVLPIVRSIYSLRTGSPRLESLIRELVPRRLTGLLKVTFDEYDGIIAFDEGVVIDGYEIFNEELLVKDRNGRHIVERQKAEPGKITIFAVQREVLQSFLRTLQEIPPQSILTRFSCLCSGKGSGLMN